MLAAVLLTAAQLVVGSMASLVLIWISKFVLPSYSISAIASSSSSSSHVIVGLLHCIGCLCTNIGFAFGSASLVQVIKLLEPIETLLLSAIVIVLTNTDYATRISEILSVKKMASTFIIVGGTSMLLAQKEMEANYKSIVFALGSGFCMALRNVLKKNGGDRDTNYNRGRSVKEEKLPSSCGEVFLKGMYNFTLITTMSAIPCSSHCFAGNAIQQPLPQSGGGIDIP
jgi:drug/metabolite transporter (DMT)-like permease